jgi:PKD repeat protein
MQKINKLSFQAFWLLMMVFTVSACKKEETPTPTPTPLAKPVVSFGFPNTGLNAPCDVVFTNITSGESVSYQWDFGDGGVSTDKTPTHRYNTAGTYTVVLTASNSGGSGTASKSITIGTQAAPVANFSFPSTTLAVGTAVAFTNTTIGNNCTYLWNFGDGTNSTDANPTHNYANTGTYYVRLTATNNGGSNFVEKTVTIEAAPVTYTQFTVTRFTILQIGLQNQFYNLKGRVTDATNNFVASSDTDPNWTLPASAVPYTRSMTSFVNSSIIAQNATLTFSSINAGSGVANSNKAIEFKPVDYRPVSNNPIATSEAIINTTDGWGVKIVMQWTP